MKIPYAILKLVMLLSIPLYSGLAIGKGVYLYCVSELGLNKDYVHVSNIGDAYTPFMEKYQYSSAHKQRGKVSSTVINSNDVLFIYGYQSIAENTTYAYNYKNENPFNYMPHLVFDDLGKAKTFCEDLSDLCAKEHGDTYKYAVGGRDYVQGYWGIGFIYRAGNNFHGYECPNPRNLDFSEIQLPSKEGGVK